MLEYLSELATSVGVPVSTLAEPSCPLAFAPQQNPRRSVSGAAIPHECCRPALISRNVIPAMADGLPTLASIVEPSPSLPLSPRPQQKPVPSFRSAQVCSNPPLMDENLSV